ncbi:MAG: T9SS type A sorting domain-containing protein [Bacteroidia bacterium]|jgi:hypothetical protein
MKKIILTIIAMVVMGFMLIAQPAVSWVRNYETIPNYFQTVSHAEIDFAGNIVIGGHRVSNNSTKRDPLVVKYDPTGNEVFTWVHPDSIYDEWINDFAIDSIGNIYLFTIGETKKLIKLSQSGQELFNIAFPDTALGGVIAIHHQFIYLAYGFPNSKLIKYDLQGNPIWSILLNGFFRVEKIHVFQNQLYLIGDSVLSPSNWTQLVKIYDNSGLFQSSVFTNINEPLYLDSEIDLYGNLWITGFNANAKGYLAAINNGNIVLATLIGGNNEAIGVTRLLQNGNSILWSYNKSTSSGTINETIKFNNLLGSSFAFIDSVKTVGNGYYGLELINSNTGDIIIINTRAGSLNFNHDYELTAFDSSGNLLWNFVYSNDSLTRDEAFKLLMDDNNNSLYIVGNNKHTPNGTSQINTLKLDLATSIKEKPDFEKFIIYPTPTDGNSINFNYNINGAIILFDLHGRLIYNENNFTGSILTLPTNLKQGLYILQIETKGGILRKKLIKTNPK